MIRHLYPERRARAQALGIWAAVSGLALALGPVIGGVLVGLWSWHAVFWFNLIFGALAFVAAAIVLPENSDPVRARLDLPGFVLGALALGTATLRHYLRRNRRLPGRMDPGPLRDLRAHRHCLRAGGATGTESRPRREALSPAAVRRRQHRGIHHLLRHLLHLLLRRPLPGGGGRPVPRTAWPSTSSP